MGICDADAGVLYRLVMCDETKLHLSGYVNKQNCRYYNDEQSR